MSSPSPSPHLFARLSNTFLGPLLEAFHVDFVPADPQPSWPRWVVATVVSLIGSLATDAALAAGGKLVFPSTAGFVHFRFSDYAKLTVIGVLIACAAWPLVTRLSSRPRWLFLRLAVVVTLVLLLPDVWIGIRGESATGILVLVVMHLAIGVITYNALVRIAPAGEARPTHVEGTARAGADPGAVPDGPEALGEDTGVRPSAHPAAIHWLADYVYGTIATLVAIAGLTFETNPGELTTAAVVIVGAFAIWMAHMLSRLVSKRSGGHLRLNISDVVAEARTSWSIVTAAIPATLIFMLAGAHLWTMHTAFVLADVVGVLALAVVGIGTAGGNDRPLARRIAYVWGLVMVGIAIVLLEAGIHLL